MRSGKKDGRSEHVQIKWWGCVSSLSSMIFPTDLCENRWKVGKKECGRENDEFDDRMPSTLGKPR